MAWPHRPSKRLLYSRVRPQVLQRLRSLPDPLQPKLHLSLNQGAPEAPALHQGPSEPQSPVLRQAAPLNPLRQPDLFDQA